MNNLKNKKKLLPGYTLVEVLVYVLVLSIVVTGVTTILLIIFRTKTAIEDRANTNEDLRILVKSIRDDMFLGNDLEVVGSNTLKIYSSANPDITYTLTSNQVTRQEGITTPVPLTAETTDVRSFDIEDLSTPSAAGTIRITIEVANYPRGTLKPEIVEHVTSTMSLKFL